MYMRIFQYLESRYNKTFRYVSSFVSGAATVRAKFFKGNINIYLHFVSYLHIDTTHAVEILPQIKQEPTYSI